MYCTAQNINHKLQTTSNTITAWLHRDLSTKGKTLVINGLLAYTLWCHASNISFPDWVLSAIEDLIYKFLRSNKRPLLNRDILLLNSHWLREVSASSGLQLNSKHFALTPSTVCCHPNKHTGNSLPRISSTSHTCPLVNTLLPCSTV